METKKQNETTTKDSIEYIRDKLKVRYEKTIKQLSGFEKMNKKGLAEGRRSFVENSILEFRAKRDEIDNLLKWINEYCN